jgi:peroxiredoxin
MDRPMGRRASAFLAAAVLAAWPLPAAAQQAYDFSLKDLSGAEVRLGDLWQRGPVLISFWATWCLPCAKELPHLQKLADAYADRGVTVLAVSVDAPASAAGVAAFVRRYGFTMPVLLDSESRVVALYNPRLTLPFTVLIDKGGRIAHVHQGYSPGDETGLEERLAALLARPERATESAPAPRLSPGISESFLFRRFTDDAAIAGREGRSSQVLNQLDLTLSRKGALIGLRADAGLDFSPAAADFRLAKAFLEQTGRGWSARLGDFHLSLGRGMVFSVLKIFEREGLEHVVDTTVRGGRASFGSDRWEGQVFGGWIEREEDASVRDRVAGGAVRWRAWGNARLGFNAVAAGLEPGAEYGSRSAGLGSLTMEIPSLLGGASFYGELSLIRRSVLGAEEPVSGHGLYLQASYRTSRIGALLEVKDYRDFNFEYARPPILEGEELDILADQFDEDRTGVAAAALRLDRFWPEAEALAYIRLSWIRDAPERHDLFGAYRRAIFHVYGGWEKKLGGGGYVHVLAGWRREEADSIAFLATDGDTVHGQINASLPLGGRWSLEADWKRKEFRGAEYAYSEDRAGLSLHASPRWVAALLYERSSEPSVEALTGRSRWAGAQLELKAGTFLYLRAFVGSSKGSTKCAGGVCKALPPFTGLRLEAVVRY